MVITDSPVTHTALVEVKSAFKKFVHSRLRALMGRHSKKAPNKIIIKKPDTIMCAGESLNLFL